MVKDLVSITIVNWNSKGYIEKCLDSIKNQTYRNLEVIVIDNNSTDASLEFIINNFPEAKIIKNSQNQGFSKAHNQGITLAGGEYILVLNFDVFLEPDFISEMVNAMKNSPEAGIISGKLYKQANGDKTRIFDSTGITMKYCFMHPRGEKELDQGQYDTAASLKIFGACGAAPFYRKAMLEDIKCFDEYFDEDFVNYVEDVDLSWRALLRGWKCLYNPRAIAYHERGVTRKDNRDIQEAYLIFGLRNRYCSMIKNIPFDYWRKNKFKIMAIEMNFLLKANKELPRPLRIKALYLALKLQRRMSSKRKLIQQKRRLADDSLEGFLAY